LACAAGLGFGQRNAPDRCLGFFLDLFFVLARAGPPGPHKSGFDPLLQFVIVLRFVSVLVAETPRSIIERPLDLSEQADDVLSQALLWNEALGLLASWRLRRFIQGYSCGNRY